MSESEEFIFNNGYIERVKRFRGETNMSAEEMADLLGVPADRYRKYESRSPMPVYLVASFCRIVGCDLEHLILGKPRERIKPIIIPRKTAPLADVELADLAQRAKDIENTPDGQQKLEKFAHTFEQQHGKRRKLGT